MPADPCKACHGSGSVSASEEIEVKIPRGVNSNQRIRYKGMGQSHNGQVGDLYVVLVVDNDKYLTRDGDNLVTWKDVTFPEAALGTELDVNVFGDNVKIKIPSGTQPGDTVRAKGSGFPRLNSQSSGDLLVRVNVIVPKHLTSRQKELLSQFDEEKDKKKIWGKR